MRIAFTVNQYVPDFFEEDKIVFISSSNTVYGVSKDFLINERHPTDHLVSCGITKCTKRV